MSEQQGPRPEFYTDDRVPWPPQPAVFMLQPTEYEFVPPERLVQWQHALHKYAGIRAELNLAAGYPTFCKCGTREGCYDFDDCDFFR
jgi:hypothetical protein